MTARSFALASFALMAFPMLALSDPPGATGGKPSRNSPAAPEAFAQTVWEIMDLVEAQHIEAPPRQQMFQAGVQALLKAAGQTYPPQDLGRRISKLVNQEQYRACLEEAWPKDVKDKSVTPEALQNAMLQGMLQSLPGEGQFFSASDIKAQRQISMNRYVGIGIQLAWDKKLQLPQITNPFRVGTAYKGGSHPGDYILRVDEHDTHGTDLGKVVQWLRGPEGTHVTIVVRQPDAKETRTLHLTREVVPFDTVYGYRRGAEGTWNYRVDSALPIGYVWINTILSSTPQELRRLQDRFQADGIRGLVLDLRYCNSAETIHNAQMLADALLDHGIIWRARNAQGEVTEYRADPECLFRGMPMVILINDKILGNGVQSIVAALQDNGRARLVGEPTHATGLVKSVLELPNGQGAVTFATARLERPAADKAWPVEPDELVPLTSKEQQAIQRWFHFKEMTELPRGVTDQAPDDPQLHKAIEMLQATLKTREDQARRESAK